MSEVHGLCAAGLEGEIGAFLDDCLGQEFCCSRRRSRFEDDELIAVEQGRDLFACVLDVGQVRFMPVLEWCRHSDDVVVRVRGLGCGSQISLRDDAGHGGRHIGFDERNLTGVDCLHRGGVDVDTDYVSPRACQHRSGRQPDISESDDNDRRALACWRKGHRPTSPGNSKSNLRPSPVDTESAPQASE